MAREPEPIEPIDTSEPTEPPRTVAGRYRIVQLLGRGSFGQTFLALDTAERDRRVALKRLHPEKSSSLKAFELFEREAAVLRSLRHHGIPAVYDSFHGTWDGTAAAYLVLEYIEGTSLAQLLRSGQRPGPVEVLQIFLGLLDILDYLHNRVPPVLHRDIKPANILLRPGGAPVLVDFGSVRSVFLGPAEGGSTVVGTFGYMPFEQFMGQASPASDLYALGATFLHVLTGRPPSDFLTEANRIAVPEGLPAPEPLRPVIPRLIEPAPADRFQSARQVREALLAPVSLGSPALLPVRAGLPAIRARVHELGPPPRELDAELKRLLKRLAPSTWHLMNSDKKPSEPLGFGVVMLNVLASVFTAGIMPMIYAGIALDRRRRYRKFLQFGLLGRAKIQSLETEKMPFDEKLVEVRYQFEADGRLYRGISSVFPSVAKTWGVGDEIQVLYLPQEDYDSVVISG
jgi:serine/threonine protein kinase